MVDLVLRFLSQKGRQPKRTTTSSLDRVEASGKSGLTKILIFHATIHARLLYLILVSVPLPCKTLETSHYNQHSIVNRDFPSQHSVGFKRYFVKVTKV